jgi:hypothetical protein
MTIVTSDNAKQASTNFFIRWFQSLFLKDNKDVMVVKEVEPGSVEWVASVSDIEYNAYLDYILDNINIALDANRITFKYALYGNNSNMTYYLSSAINLVSKIDRQNIKSHTKISKTLKFVINTIDILSVYDNKTWPNEDICRSLFYSTKDNFEVTSEAVKDVKLLSNLTNDKWKNSSQAIKNIQQSYDFNNLKDFGNVSSRFKLILESLKVKENILLNIEDKYIIDEIENKYLPNMYSSAISLKASNENAIELIEHELNIQFDFMESEIARINSSLYAHAMNTLKSQSHFALTRMNEIKASQHHSM